MRNRLALIPPLFLPHGEGKKSKKCIQVPLLWGEGFRVRAGKRAKVLMVLGLFLLAGCGVRVVVEEPIPPTPTLPEIPNSAYPDWGITRIQAAPRLTFTDPDNAHAELFMQPDQPDIYLLQYRTAQLSVDYDAIWYAALRSSAQLRLNVYVRYAPDAAWELYDQTESNLITQTVPFNTEESTVVGLYREDITQFEVRAEVSAVMYSADGQISNQVSANEFRVYILDDVGDITVDSAALTPVFGDPDPAVLLLDWRAWDGGPCGLADSMQDDPAHETLVAACDAFNNDDMEGAVSTLVEAAQQTENQDLLANLTAIVGLLTAALGDLASAAEAFENGVAVNLALNHPWELTVSLHNLASVWLTLEDGRAYAVLQQVDDLHDQFYDEAGNNLMQANLSRVFSDQGQLEDVRGFFEENDLPQLGIIEAWLEELQNDQ